MKVKKIVFNWFVNTKGEQSSHYEVGKEGVSEINEYQPRNGLQQWNYFVDFNDGKMVRVFNPNQVEYFKIK